MPLPPMPRMSSLIVLVPRLEDDLVHALHRDVLVDAVGLGGVEVDVVVLAVGAEADRRGPAAHVGRLEAEDIGARPEGDAELDLVRASRLVGGAGRKDRVRVNRDAKDLDIARSSGGGVAEGD